LETKELKLDVRWHVDGDVKIEAVGLERIRWDLKMDTVGLE